MSGGVRLRPARPDDAAACHAIYAPIVRDTPISFEIEPPSARALAGRIEASTRHPWLVCVQAETLLGYAYAGAHRTRAAYRWSAEVSVYASPERRRRGAARALYGALLRILAFQGFHRALAGITLPNPASVALHEACGFTPVGVYRQVGFKCGAWHDVGWWERALADPALPPREPRDFAEIAQAPEVAEALAAAASGVLSA